MSQKVAARSRSVPTGIEGFDEITGGGLPSGRITVVLGGAGSGKTIFGIQSLASGARDHGEPGIFVAFEESATQVLDNTAGFSWSTHARDAKRVGVVDAQLSASVLYGGDFDILGILAILGAKAKAMKAKRVVFDGLDVLLANLGDPSLARREVFRLREWLQSSGMTAILTAKSDARELGPLPEYEFLQFMADCVVTLQHRLVAGTALRFLRVAKYRGGAHSANEVAFNIAADGIEVAPVTHSELRHHVSSERISTGIARLDAMLEGGYYRGSSTLVSGVPGTAKTTLGAAFADAASARRERTLIVSFDESPEQIVRNVASVGIRLAPHLKSGALRICSLRSRIAGPEVHLAKIRALLREHQARNLVIDPLSALAQLGQGSLADDAAVQILDIAKSQGVTSVSTSLLGNPAAASEETPIGISTIADTWIHLTYVSQGGERNRALTIVKSRGTGHSNQVRELVLSSDGVTLSDVYSAGGEVLMGTLRWQKEDEERRHREASARDASQQEREAELALAETEARVKVVDRERALRVESLQRVRSLREEEALQSTQQTTELQRRRRGDASKSVRAKRTRSSTP